jgi:hypothetical protein
MIPEIVIVCARELMDKSSSSSSLMQVMLVASIYQLMGPATTN